MSKCTDNPKLGIIGCGAVYTGNLQHSVAKVDWSTHADGRAHITGALSAIDKCWKGDVMRHPTKVGLELVNGRVSWPQRGRGRAVRGDR